MTERICIFGDSIVWGAVDSLGGWASRLRSHFEKDSDIEVYNLGISGNTSEDLVKRIEEEAKARNTELIIIAIGANDSAYDSKKKNKIPLEEYEKNLREILNISRKYADKIILVSPINVDEKRTMPVFWNKEKFLDNKTIENYGKVVKKLASKEKIGFIDLFGSLEDEDLEDGLHPNSKGHEKIFLKVKDYLIENKLIN